jgi:hypothetical protein
VARKKKAPKQKFPDGIIVAVGKEPAYIADYDPEFHDDEEGPYTLTPIDLHGSFEAHESEIRAITGAEVIALLEVSGDSVRAADIYEAGRNKPHYGFKVAPWVKEGHWPSGAPKAGTKRKKGSAARPHFGKSAQELCAIGDKACREELRLRGRDPKTGKKAHWG